MNYYLYCHVGIVGIGHIYDIVYDRIQQHGAHKDKAVCSQLEEASE